MPQINVVKAFFLNIGGELQKFEAGVQNVAKEIADHWFTQAHCEPVAGDDNEADAPKKRGRPAKDSAPEPTDAPTEAPTEAPTDAPKA